MRGVTSIGRQAGHDPGSAPLFPPRRPWVREDPRATCRRPTRYAPPARWSRGLRPQGHDATRLLALDRPPKVGLGVDGLALDRKRMTSGPPRCGSWNRTSHAGPPGRHVGHDETARHAGELKLLRGIRGETGSTLMPRRPVTAPARTMAWSRSFPRAAAATCGASFSGCSLTLKVLRTPPWRDLDLDHVAGPPESDHLLQLADVLHRLAVHRHDDVPRARCRPPWPASPRSGCPSPRPRGSPGRPT